MAAINTKLHVAVLATGSLTINANLIIRNELGDPVNVNDGEKNVVLRPGETIGAYSPSGPDDLQIEMCHCNHNLDERSQDVVRVPNVTTTNDGILLKIVEGVPPRPFAWHESMNHNFEHIQLPLELRAILELQESEKSDSDS